MIFVTISSFLPKGIARDVSIAVIVIFTTLGGLVGCGGGNGGEMEPTLSSVDRQLWQAVYDGDAGKVKIALNNGARVNSRDRDERTPLIEAVVREDYDMANVLLNSGADVNAFEFAKSSPLQFAVLRRNTKMVKLLLKAGAFVEHRDENGNTAIFQAVRGFQAGTNNEDVAKNEAVLAIVGLLLSSGADPDSTTPDGIPIVKYAENSGRLPVAELLRRTKDENQGSR